MSVPPPGAKPTMMFDTAASILPHVRGGKLRGLASARESRLPEYPDLVTFSEAGVKGYEVNAWYSVHAPAGVPRDIVMKVNRELVRILGLPDIKERLKALGSEGIGNSPEEFASSCAPKALNMQRRSKTPAPKSSRLRPELNHKEEGIMRMSP